MTAVSVLGLIVCLLLVLVFYFWIRLNQMSVKEDKDVQPLDTGFIAWVALVFVFIIVCVFSYLGETNYKVSGDVGQVGDFIGGLTNPVLSFLALLVLLRTTRIQTLESRKTTDFMRSQQELLEREKFENTFFQLLTQMDRYCEKHFRTDSGRARAIRDDLLSKREELNLLPKEQQMAEARKHIDEIARKNDCVMFSQKYFRILTFIDDAQLDEEALMSYAAILRDTVYPDESILIVSFAARRDVTAQMVKKWRLADVRRGYYVCDEIENYYFDRPSLY